MAIVFPLDHLPAVDDTVAVYLLDPEAFPVAGCAAPLDDAERARAARFHREVDRRRFVACRALLRHLLARETGVDATRLRFDYGAAGKPSLAGSVPEIEFNVSHTEGCAAIALARGTPLGVDVERIRPLPDLERLAARFFSAQEATAVLAAPPARRADVFFRCWTRKEACLKGIGDGFTAPLDGFTVSVDTPPRILARDRVPGLDHAWRLHDVAAGAHHVAAVAVRGTRRVRCHRLASPRSA